MGDKLKRGWADEKAISPSVERANWPEAYKQWLTEWQSRLARVLAEDEEARLP